MRTGTKLGKFFFVRLKWQKIKELFASVLNGVTANVRCLSSMIVVLNAKLTRSIAAHVNKQTVRIEEADKSAVFC